MKSIQKETMKDQQLYKSAIEFLLSFDGVTQEDLDNHLTSELKKPEDIKIIYRRLCESAQNKQMSSKVIGNAIGGIDNLKKVLHDFDPYQVANTYEKTDIITLLKDIKEQLQPVGQFRTTKKVYGHNLLNQ